MQVLLPSDRTTVQVTAGGLHALAALDNGDAYAWGGDTAAQLANS